MKMMQDEDTIGQTFSGTDVSMISQVAYTPKNATKPIFSMMLTVES